MKSPLLIPESCYDTSLLLDEEIKTLKPMGILAGCMSTLREPDSVPAPRLNVFAANAVGSYLKRGIIGSSIVSTLCEVSLFKGSYTVSCQYQKEDDIYLALCSETGQVAGCKIDTNETFLKFPRLDDPRCSVDLTVFYIAVLAVLVKKDVHIKGMMAALQHAFFMTRKIPDAQFYQFCDDLVYYLENDMFQLNLGSSEVVPITAKNVANGLLAGTVIYGNKNSILSGKFQKKPGSKDRVKTFKDLYELAEYKNYRDSLKWTKEEKKLIPNIHPDFPVSKEVEKMAKRFVMTRNEERGINNILWRGTSGLGKSTGVEVLASLLGTPLLKQVCFSTMDTQDFLSTFVPCDNDEGPKFKLISSNFIIALEKGYICEVQEMSRIKDQGVPVGLNEYDHPEALIRKADGTYVKRHKDALVVYTDNIGYQTVHDYDPSVLRRMSFCLETREISEADAKARIRYNTKLDDENLLSRAYDAWKSIKTYCENNGLDAGICTINELEMFCKLLTIDGEECFQQDLLEAVIYKATSEEEEIMELRKLFSL